MATFSVGRGFFANFASTPIATADGEITVADSTLIRISVDRVPAGFENFIGAFSYTDAGLPLGTVREFRLTSGAELIYRIAQADIDVLELRRIAGADDPQAFLRYIFRADDRLTGAGLGDQMSGYAGADRLLGLAGDDSLFGGRGRDLLRGGPGADWLDGGPGADRLTGGGGRDTFLFREHCRADTVTDFGACDRIGLGFDGLGPAGPLDPAAFHIGAQALAPEQRILYDSDTGWLLYAAQGSDTDHPARFAHIGEGLADLGAADFLVL